MPGDTGIEKMPSPRVRGSNCANYNGSYRKGILLRPRRTDVSCLSGDTDKQEDLHSVPSVPLWWTENAKVIYSLEYYTP